MQRTIIIALSLQSALTVAGDWHMGGKTADKIKEAVHEGVTGLKDIQSTIPATVAKCGDEFGKNVVKGGINEIKNQGNSGKEYVFAAGAAILALPYAPYVLGAGAAVLTAGTALKYTIDYKDWRFRRCMNTHFSGSLNDRGFPQRCESPERRLNWWCPEASTESIEHYRGQRRLTQKILKGAAQPS